MKNPNKCDDCGSTRKKVTFYTCEDGEPRGWCSVDCAKCGKQLFYNGA